MVHPHGGQPRAGGGEAAIGGSSAVKVVVRVRPLNQNELARGEQNSVEVTEDQRALRVHYPDSNGHFQMREFAFNACLATDATQADVMTKCGVPRLLDSALKGYSSTIFAYGQTGSGKTFSMSGREEVISEREYRGASPDTDGIISRSLAHIYQTINRIPGVTHVVKCDYLEIYNEQIYDLLAGNDVQLHERWEPQRGFHVPGLQTIECERLDDAREIIRQGMLNRAVGSHELNKDSSRSHSIFTVHIESIAEVGGQELVKHGKIAFVDLAGSERLKDSKSEGGMVKETANINRSLFMLGKVNATLAEGKAGTTHVPYRDSKLTKLLMDSLGGSSLALMVACCSPSPLHVEETMSTLHYATRARNIINRPTVAQDPQQQLISRLKDECETLRKENGYLRQQLGLPANQPSGIPGMSAHAGRPVNPEDPGSPLASISRPPGRGGSLMMEDGSIPRSPSKGGPPASMGGTTRRAQSREASREKAKENDKSRGLGDLDPWKENVNLGKGSPNRGGLPRLDSQRSISSSHSTYREEIGDLGDGNMPIDGEFAGMTKYDLVSRIHVAEELVENYEEENSRLLEENDSVRGSKQLLEMDYQAVLEENEKLASRLEALEYSFLDKKDGTAGAFGLTQDKMSKMALSSTFGTKGNAKRSLAMGSKPSKPSTRDGGNGPPKPGSREGLGQPRQPSRPTSVVDNGEWRK